MPIHVGACVYIKTCVCVNMVSDCIRNSAIFLSTFSQQSLLSENNYN